MLIKEFIRYGDKLCIVKKRMAGERVKNVELVKEFYGAQHCVKNPQNPFEYIFLEIIPDIEYEEIKS